MSDSSIIIYTDPQSGSSYSSSVTFSITGVTSNHVLLNDTLPGATANVTWTTGSGTLTLAFSGSYVLPQGLTYFLGLPET